MRFYPWVLMLALSACATTPPSSDGQALLRQRQECRRAALVNQATPQCPDYVPLSREEHQRYLRLNARYPAGTASAQIGGTTGIGVGAGVTGVVGVGGSIFGR
jgi:hypothetical protein